MWPRPGLPATAPIYLPAPGVPRPEELEAAAEVLNAGRKVALLVGAGALHAREEVLAVADTLGAEEHGEVVVWPDTFTNSFHPEIGRAAVDADAVVQRHCHQYAVMGFDADRHLMERAGVRADVLDAGCCGLAGNFGFERGHYRVSRDIAELGPAAGGPQRRSRHPDHG
jgi:Fe-S oxidoreductase